MRKSEKLSDAIGEISDDIIEEAYTYKPKHDMHQRKASFKWRAAVAVLAMLVLAGVGVSLNNTRTRFLVLISPAVSASVSSLTVLLKDTRSPPMLRLKIQPVNPTANNPKTIRAIHSFFSILIALLRVNHTCKHILELA